MAITHGQRQIAMIFAAHTHRCDPRRFDSSEFQSLDRSSLYILSFFSFVDVAASRHYSRYCHCCLLMMVLICRKDD